MAVPLICARASSNDRKIGVPTIPMLITLAEVVFLLQNGMVLLIYYSPVRERGSKRFIKNYIL
jgi:hypothetical protein